MRDYGIAINKYWVTHIGYFILTTKLALVIWITYVKFIFCNDILDKSRENKIKIRYYNYSVVYD